MDPLSQIVGLLQPKADLSKLIVAGGAWHVHRTDEGRPFYCAILEGRCRLDLAGQAALMLEAGDFVLVPAAYDFVMSSLESCVEGETARAETSPGVFRLGPQGIKPDMRMLVGHCTFASDDVDLLVSLLPQLVHVRGEQRLSTLVAFVNDEMRSERPGREAVLTRLLEVLLIEALRSAPTQAAPSGLLRGLCDDRLAIALRCIHDRPAEAWTVDRLAREAALSRTTFFERFRGEVGVAPMEYVVGWRMTLAKDLLRRGRITVAEAAERVGYGSASAFSTAFARRVGIPPAHYARAG